MPIKRSTEDVADISTATLDLIVSVDHFRTLAGEQLGIGVSGLKTLSFLNLRGPSTAGELAHASDVTSGSMTATLDKLASHQLVERRPSETDRRSVLVVITPEGERAIGGVLKLYRTALLEALASNPETDAEATRDYLVSAAVTIRSVSEQVPNLPHGS